MTAAFSLPASPAGVPRRYAVVPIGVHLADVYMTIQVGAEGPRGGRSHVTVEGYFVQPVDVDPERPHAAEYLLAKDDGWEVYGVTVYPRGSRCTCDGFRGTGDCKHRAAVWHAVRVAGLLGSGHGRAEVATAGEAVPVAGDDGDFDGW